MYKVTPNFTMPAGYSLQEDTDVLYLIRGGRKVAAFMPEYASPQEILRTCREYDDLTKGVTR